MILKINKIQSRRVCIVKCDTCNAQFEKSYVKRYVDQEFHFCSRKCLGRSHSQGQVRAKKEETCLERYGDPIPARMSDIKKKTRQTNVKKYGVDHPSKLPEFQEKIERSSLETYGTKRPSQAPVIKERTKKTCKERYGGVSPLQNKDVLKKRRKRFREKHGVDNPSQLDEVKEKKVESYKRRYGVDHPLKAPEVVDKIDWQAAWKRAHQTKKRNGTYTGSTSKIEREFGQFLAEHDLEHETQVKVKNWVIDFYIPSLDVYIQFDGVYWHGLDRTLNEIQESSKKRDIYILKVYNRDRTQDRWFKTQGLCLIRITDLEFKSDPFSCLDRIRSS